MIQSDSLPLLLAHQTQIDGEVGGTHHIEPNDTPRAGESAITWFALVQAGGKAIPLEDCDCTLAVYQSPQKPGEAAIATPPLRAIDVEGQTNVPAADIVFPTVGAYELVISGTSQGTATFAPFELRFPITVAAGKTQAPESQTSPAEASEDAEVTSTDSAQTVATSAQTAISSDPTATSEDISSPNSLPLGVIGIGVAVLGAIALLIFSRLRQ